MSQRRQGGANLEDGRGGQGRRGERGGIKKIKFLITMFKFDFSGKKYATFQWSFQIGHVYYVRSEKKILLQFFFDPLLLWQLKSHFTA